MNFLTTPFAIAGLIATLGPIIIHILNRRRFRVVDWAAMDFLKEAMQRSRKVLQIRDLLLLLCRILAVGLFGLVLARPFFTNYSQELTLRTWWVGALIVIALGLALWSVLSSVKTVKVLTGLLFLGTAGLAVQAGMKVASDKAALADNNLSERQPVHAVLLVDNSFSMGYEVFDGTLLDRAKRKARDFIEKLPAQSRVTVIPLCGSVHVTSLDAFRSLEDAREAVDLIEVVDRSGSAPQALELASAACEKVAELSAKRVVFFSDQQLLNWPLGSYDGNSGKVPELQVVQVRPENETSVQNVWIADFRVQDGIADISTKTNFLVTVEYQGSQALSDVQVTLKVADTSIATQTIELKSGQARQLEFPYQIDLPAEPGQPRFVTAEASVSIDSVMGDRLKQDNTRYLSVPVVSELPVVFIDQQGENENPNQRGETHRLRRLLNPQSSREKTDRHVIQVRHTTIEGVTKQMLQDARLVVIGGVKSPEPAVTLLREFVEQGGQLFIAAGGEFDPAAWNKHAWQDGLGILPYPLKPEPFGINPTQWTGDESFKNFHLDYSTMLDDFFLVEQTDQRFLKDLYQSGSFFKTIQIDDAAAGVETLLKNEKETLIEKRELIAESEKQRQEWSEKDRRGTLSEQDIEDRKADQELRSKLEPDWLIWKREQLTNLSLLDPEELAKRSTPQVLARYQGNRLISFASRKVGLGEIILFGSSIHSDWNTLVSEHAHCLFLFDRILRKLLEKTLPERTFETGSKIALPAKSDQRLRYVLTRPNGFEENLPVLALGSDVSGITIPQALSSGVYRVNVSSQSADGAAGIEERVEEIPIVINGPADESQLTSLESEEELKKRLEKSKLAWQWLNEGDEIKIEGAQIRGRDIWKVLAILVVAFLLIEMLILAWPMLGKRLSPSIEEPGR